MTDEDRTFLEGLYEHHPDSPKNRDEEPLEPEIVIYLDGEVLDRDSASLERIQGMMSQTYCAALERVTEPKGEIREAHFRTLAKPVDIFEPSASEPKADRDWEEYFRDLWEMSEEARDERT